MDIQAYLRPVFRWWWLILAATLLAAVSSYLQVRQQPPLYVASTTLIIGRAFDDPNPTGSELTLGQQLAETYADLAQRRVVREATMTALGLTSLPEYSASPLPNRQLLEITVIDTSPERAKAVADELANQLIQHSPTAPKAEDQERDAFISDQLSSLQANISQTELDISAKQAELEPAIGALEISELQNDIAALQAKLTTLQANYAALLANTNQGASNTIEVIEPAALPVTPTGSGAAQMILVASAFGLVLATGTAYLLDFLDDTVRSEDDLPQEQGVASLPGIPEFQANGSGPVVLAGNGASPMVVDAFRAMRTGLYAATANKHGKTYLITSAAPKEGKSVVAANLAVVLAQGEKKVLLIDADLHRPKQHELFGVPGEYGLAELLVALHKNEQPDRHELTRMAIQTVGPTQLGVMAAGSDRANAVGLLGSDTMKTLLDIVSPYADYVIIDSPPVLAVADALILSIQVDGVVLVASAHSSPRRHLKQALKRLTEVNATLTGVVVNRQKTVKNGYYGYEHTGH
jgi:succinoglycan biosynthesis transport protein ExoP